MLHLPIHPIFHISKYLFYPVDGIIHLFSCICNLALHHIICHQPVQKEIRKGKEAADFHAQIQGNLHIS